MRISNPGSVFRLGYSSVMNQRASVSSRFNGVPLLQNRLMLQYSKFSLAMATSKPEVFAKRIADKFDLTQYFDFIGGSLLDNSRTDKGEVIEYVLSSLKADREKTIMVGDRFHDILGAKRCGVLSVGVLYGFGSLAELKEAGADYIAETPKKLEELLMAI